MSVPRALLAAAVVLLLAGCVSERELMQETRRPRNTFFDAGNKLPDMKLGGDQSVWFHQLDCTDGQSLHLMMLAKDAMLKERYHYKHDMTLLCIQGSAIVQVEGERQYIEAPASVFVPRLRAYKIIPHKCKADFVALQVYSPKFDGLDVLLTEEEEEE